MSIPSKRKHPSTAQYYDNVKKFVYAEEFLSVQKLGNFINQTRYMLTMLSSFSHWAENEQWKCFEIDIPSRKPCSKKWEIPTSSKLIFGLDTSESLNRSNRFIDFSLDVS